MEVVSREYQTFLNVMFGMIPDSVNQMMAGMLSHVQWTCKGSTEHSR